jgi:Glycosyltransferase family 87
MVSLRSRASQLHPALRLAIGLWLVFGVAVSVRTLLLSDQHTVFPVFATASKHFWDQQSLYARYRPLDYFRYPPVFAIGFTPLSALGLTGGGLLWNWLNLGVYGWGLWRFRRDVLPGTWTPGREALFLSIGLFGGLRGLWNGQSNALAVGLLLLAIAAVTRRRWWAAAFLLAMPVLVKLTPLAPALLLCALWPRKLIGRFSFALAVGLLLPFLVKSPRFVLQDYQDWFTHLLDTSSERWPGFRDVWTVWLAARHLLFGAELSLTDSMAHPLLYRLVQIGSGLGVLAWCLWQQRRGTDTRLLLTLTLAMGSAWLMLFGPAVEHATYVFLAPPLAWAASQRSSWRPGQFLLVPALALVLVFGWGALIRLWPAAEPFLLLALPLGTVLFTVWLCGYAAAGVPVGRVDAVRSPIGMHRFIDRPHTWNGVHPVGRFSKAPRRRVA